MFKGRNVRSWLAIQVFAIALLPMVLSSADLPHDEVSYVMQPSFLLVSNVKIAVTPNRTETKCKNKKSTSRVEIIFLRYFFQGLRN